MVVSPWQDIADAFKEDETNQSPVKVLEEGAELGTINKLERIASNLSGEQVDTTAGEMDDVADDIENVDLDGDGDTTAGYDGTGSSILDSAKNTVSTGVDLVETGITATYDTVTNVGDNVQDTVTAPFDAIKQGFKWVAIAVIVYVLFSR